MADLAMILLGRTRDGARVRVPASARRWWPAAAVALLGACGGAVYAAVQAPSYTAQAYVAVVSEQIGDGTTAADFAKAYGRILNQPGILRNASVAAGVPADRLRAQVRGTTSPDAPVIEITGTAGDGDQAAATANAVAAALVRYGNADSSQTRVKLVTFGSAVAPDEPSSPAPAVDIAVGGAVGVLVGALGLLARGERPPGGPAPRSEAAGEPSPAAEVDEPVGEVKTAQYERSRA